MPTGTVARGIGHTGLPFALTSGTRLRPLAVRHEPKYRRDSGTGITVVENGLYIVRYMINASVWTVGFLFVGLVEYVARSTWDWLPSTPPRRPRLSIPATRREAVLVATVAGVLHAVAMVGFAARLGVTISGGAGWLLYASSTLGKWVLAALPVYLLVRHRLLAPATLLAGFVFLDVRAEFAPGADDPHALYFGAWFLFLGPADFWMALQAWPPRRGPVTYMAYRNVV